MTRLRSRHGIFMPNGGTSAGESHPLCQKVYCISEGQQTTIFYGRFAVRSVITKNVPGRAKGHRALTRFKTGRLSAVRCHAFREHGQRRQAVFSNLLPRVPVKGRGLSRPASAALVEIGSATRIEDCLACEAVSQNDSPLVTTKVQPF